MTRVEQPGFPNAGETFRTRFSQLNRAALRTPPFIPEDLPFGWLSGVEATLLYNLALVSEGAIVEIGSWVGRSTSALAFGVRDNWRRPLFDVFDLGVVGTDGFIAAFAEDPHARQPPESLAAMERPGGVPAALVQNLSERGLYKHVHMLAFCDFKTSTVSRRYSTAFCDACHYKWEIDLNIPALMQMMDSENFLIAIDDVYSLEACDYVAQMIGAEKVVSLGSESVDSQGKMSLMARGFYSKLDWFA